MKEKDASYLKKSLTTLDIFSLSAGAMISSGLFVLPGILYADIGPSIIFAYLLASLFMIPAMLAKTELATAMPKAGGAYFYINKSIGSFIGTFSGLTSWFSLALKSAFALIGLGIFILPLFPDTPDWTIKIVAVFFTILFTILNIRGVKSSGRFQVFFVVLLCLILFAYIIFTLPNIEMKNIQPLFQSGFQPTVQAAAVIFISFGGLTKIASIAEEIKNPGKTIPCGMFSAFFTVTLLYILALLSTSGVLSFAEFSTSLTPLSDGAQKSFGIYGYIFLSIAAVAAFITTANAGIMAASRTPLAMAEDNLLPKFFCRVNPKTGTPVRATLVTSSFMVLVIMLLDIEKLVKAASTMMLILFCLNCVAILLMRESGISTYRPLFKIPLYPFLPVVGVILYIYLIISMGVIPLLITGVFFAFSFLWYILYSRKRAERDSALIHVVKNITNRQIVSDALDTELRDILIQRDDIVEDRFDSIISKAMIVDLSESEADDHIAVFSIISDYFADKFSLSSTAVRKLLDEREQESSTAISAGLAIPHIIVEGHSDFEIMILRSKKGIVFPDTANNPIHQIFALAGSRKERNFHLQALMAIAQIVQNENFSKDWLNMKDEKELKNLILLAKRARQNSI